jgi:hypothetical protein
MTNKEIVNKLLEVRPGTLWVLRGTTYESLEWLDQVQVKPTREELGL